MKIVYISFIYKEYTVVVYYNTQHTRYCIVFLVNFLYCFSATKFIRSFSDVNSNANHWLSIDFPTKHIDHFRTFWTCVVLFKLISHRMKINAIRFLCSFYWACIPWNNVESQQNRESCSEPLETRSKPLVFTKSLTLLAFFFLRSIHQINVLFFSFRSGASFFASTH